jgi:hypothetical protein
MREEKGTTAFMNDAEWATKRAESKANDPLITHASNQIRHPMTFSSAM